MKEIGSGKFNVFKIFLNGHIWFPFWKKLNLGKINKQIALKMDVKKGFYIPV